VDILELEAAIVAHRHILALLASELPDLNILSALHEGSADPGRRPAFQDEVARISMGAAMIKRAREDRE
jgi:hypothetical protein